MRRAGRAPAVFVFDLADPAERIRPCRGADRAVVRYPSLSTLNDSFTPHAFPVTTGRLHFRALRRRKLATVVAELFVSRLRMEIAFKTFGDCRVSKPDFPERGLTIVSCTFDVPGLPAE